MKTNEVLTSVVMFVGTYYTAKKIVEVVNKGTQYAIKTVKNKKKHSSTITE